MRSGNGAVDAKVLKLQSKKERKKAVSLGKLANKLTKREYAAIHLKVPMSGNAELDKMIINSRVLDTIPASQLNEWKANLSGEAGK